MSGGSSGGSQSSTQTTTPWGPQGTQLRQIYSGIGSAYRRGDLGQIAPQSGLTQFAQDATVNRALGPNVTDQAIGQAGRTLSGDYLQQGNPYFQDAIRYAQQPAIEGYQDAVGSVGSQFSSAGALGSGAYAQQRNRADDTLARNLAGAATQAGLQSYESERGRQQQALGLAPLLDQAGYAGLDRIAGVGAQQDAYTQAQLDTPYRALQQYNAIVSGTPTFGTSTGFQSQQNPSNPLASGLGAGLGLLSLFGGFSDERLKTDIKHVGQLKTGEKLYSYRYKDDPSEQVHFGPMAQELEQTQPELVGEMAGFKTVDYDGLAARQQPRAFL